MARVIQSELVSIFFTITLAKKKKILCLPFLLLGLGIEPRALRILGKCNTTELQVKPLVLCLKYMY